MRRSVSIRAPGGQTRLPTQAVLPPAAPPAQTQIQVLRPPLRRAPISIGRPNGHETRPLIQFPVTALSTFFIPFRRSPVSIGRPGGHLAVVAQAPYTPPWSLAAQGTMYLYAGAQINKRFSMAVSGTLYFYTGSTVALTHGEVPAGMWAPVASSAGVWTPVDPAGGTWSS